MRQWFPILVLLALLSAMPVHGVDASMRLTLRDDGNGYVEYTLVFPRAVFVQRFHAEYERYQASHPASTIMQFAFDRPFRVYMRALLGSDVFSYQGRHRMRMTPISNSREIGFTCGKWLPYRAAVQDELGYSQSNGMLVNYTKHRGWFSDHFHLDMSTGLEIKLQTLFRQPPPFLFPCGASSMQLTLVLPAEPSSCNGSKRQKMRNVVDWHIAFMKTSALHADWVVYNTEHILSTALAGVFLLGLLLLAGHAAWHKKHPITESDIEDPLISPVLNGGRLDKVTSPFTEVEE